jgi:PleD family two-component response regulator
MVTVASNRTRPTVLLIDGDDQQRRHYVRHLQHSSQNYIVLEAKDGRSGLELYQEQPIDCVVLELALPDMSGFEVLAKLVPLARQPEIAVVILTRLPAQFLEELALNNGAAAYLVKNRTAVTVVKYVVFKAIATIAPRHNPPGLQPDCASEPSGGS